MTDSTEGLLWSGLQGSPSEASVVSDGRICVHGLHHGVRPVSMIPEIGFPFHYYCSGASNKHYNFCDYDCLSFHYFCNTPHWSLETGPLF